MLIDELMIRKKDELSDLARFYEVRGFSKLRKKELCEALASSMIKGLGMMMSFLDEDQMELFETVIEEECIPNDEISRMTLDFLESVGILNFDLNDSSNQESFVPKEIIAAYRELTKDRMALHIMQATRNRHMKWREYKRACINLYGAISIRDFIEIYIKYEERIEEYNEFYNWIYKDTFLDLEHSVIEDYIVHESLYCMGIEPFNYLIESIKGKQRYFPSTKEELLRYQDAFYEESSLLLERLRSGLSRYVVLSEGKLPGDGASTKEDVIADAIDYLIMMQRSNVVPNPDFIGYILEEWKNIGIHLQTMEEIDGMMELIRPVLNHTRMWVNNGFRPDELLTYQ